MSFSLLQIVQNCSPIATGIATAVFVGVCAILFCKERTAAKRLAKIGAFLCVSPLSYIFLVRLSDGFLLSALANAQQADSLLIIRIGMTTLFSVLLLFLFFAGATRVTGASLGLVHLILGICMVSAAVSLNMQGVTKAATALALGIFFMLLLKKELPFLAQNDKKINYRPFAIVTAITVLLVVGSMTEGLVLSPELVAGDTGDQTYAWSCVIAFILACAQILLARTISQGIRERFNAEKNLAHITALNQELLDTQDKLIQSFSEILEGKSGQSGNHVKRVSEYSALLAEAMGMDAATVHRIKVAAMMHDCGKLMIPNEILEKPARLTNDEYETMKRHVHFGEVMLRDVPGEVMHEALLVATQHHERWDGNGYLRHLKGEEIAPSSRIVAVADVFDALTSKRSYKEAWSERDAYEEIIKNRGTQFAPEVVDAFERCFPRLVEVMEAYKD